MNTDFIMMMVCAGALYGAGIFAGYGANESKDETQEIYAHCKLVGNYIFEDSKVIKCSVVE